jgi:inhibitor of KinA sporulation pathway (predicted exonuclease)
MKLMAIDCEMNQPSGRLIQIGAVAFDTKTGERLGTFRVYVNPGEYLSDEIIKLTGITQENVDGGYTPSAAYSLLEDFSKAHKVFRNPVVWGAGASNDGLEISRQAGIKDEDSFMGHRVIDVKTLCVARSIAMGNDVAGGLLSYINRVGKEWDSEFGPPHDALADALNTKHAFMLYSEFFDTFSHLERYHVQVGKPNRKGKWQGIVAKLSNDISDTIRTLATLQGLKDSLEHLDDN